MTKFAAILFAALLALPAYSAPDLSSDQVVERGKGGGGSGGHGGGHGSGKGGNGGR